MKVHLILLCLVLAGCQSAKPRYFVALEQGESLEVERGFRTLNEAESYVDYYKDNHNYIVIKK
jgi:hypothetical protein